ncbi:MAG: DNA polymerase/3'-5' exonuclease PolX [Gammaproteobacteria bacterium]|nr:DNA polymerase/3'-5' exonuclease PolX [Gammaproteobacteria bacterium]
MPVRNAAIAAIFDEIADLLEIESANPFRIRAYRNAARTIQGLGADLRVLLDQGEDLTQIPGIGKDLAAKIKEIIDTGSCAALRKLHERVPPALSDLLRIPGLGPKRVGALYKALGIRTRKQLQSALQQRRIRNLPGFGEKTEARILEVLQADLQKKRHFQLVTAAGYAESLVKYLKDTKGVQDVIVAGSVRRCKETVGDLDIVATARRDSPVMDRFTAYDEVKEVLSQGTTRTTIVLKCGLQVDLRVVPKTSLGAALQYFTGSKAHNIAIRRLGQRRGLKINEYGVFKNDRRVGGATEKSVYASVGLAYMPPELRENRGEIELARRGPLPTLVQLPDCKGDLHCHTRASNGGNSIREMALAARAHNLQYLAITDHSKGSSIARSLDERRLLAQWQEIDRLNDELEGIYLLKGIEVHILEDGRLDLADTILGQLDLVLGSIYSDFGLSRAKQTRRIQRAMNHPHFSILADPSGRLLEERGPINVDMARVIHEARNRGCFLELNAQPKRLDLVDSYCQMAKQEGVLISIDSGAYRTSDFDNLRFGVGQARRGWLTPADVLNTSSLGKVCKLLKRTMQ